MNRATLIRGIQLVVVITLATFAVILYRAIVHKQADLSVGFAHMRPQWLAVAAVLALQEGVCGGLRMFVLGRVLCPKLSVRTAVASEFVLMFVAGITPGQLGAPVSQVAVLVEGGMPFADIATAELLTAFCTIVFFLASATCVLVLRAKGLLVVPGAEKLDVLVTFSAAVFGSALFALVLCVVYPPLLKGIFRGAARVLGPLWHGVLGLLARIPRLNFLRDHPHTRPGTLSTRLVHAVDRVHEGFGTYLRRGKSAVALAFLLTLGFFWARFSVAFFILKALGLATTPGHFVTIGPAIVQVIIVQTLLNFALYLSPTPGASGIAEAGSNTLMSPWVPAAYELPYLVIWRILALFLCMFVGGSYVFRYLGTDVLERRVKEVREEEERQEAQSDP